MNSLTHKHWLGAAALALAVSLVGWIFLQGRHAMHISDPGEARKHGQPIPVRTALVAEKDVDVVIGATAITIPSESASIRIGPSRNISPNSPASDLVIRALHVHEGTPVNKGQLLLEFEDSVFNEFLKQREAAFATAKAELNMWREQIPLLVKSREQGLTRSDTEVHFRKEDLGNRQLAFDMFSRLFKDKAATTIDYWDAVSKYLQARFDYRTAEVNLQNAKNALAIGELSDQFNLAKATNDYEVARVEAELARHDVERSRVKSPLQGFVGKVDIIPGMVIGVNAQLMQVDKLDPIHVKVDFPQERIDEVSVGQQAEIVLDAFPRETFLGKVIRIYPQVNPQLRVLPVIVELANPSSRIKAGLSGFVRLKSNRKTMVVPTVSVLHQGSKTVVFRVEDGRARLREVQVGPVLEASMQEIRAGLTAGNEVVTYPSDFYGHYGDLTKLQAYLQDNDAVDTAWRKWARRE
jgi:multidrug efflux pump subunit AcrA (membrane-fusion protein)